MELPFSESQFLEVFGAYNHALWPFAAVLWLASAAILMLLLRGSTMHRGVSLLLAAHWAWVAVAYHFAFFSSINPAARLFGAVSLVQALLLVWYGIGSRAVRFSWRRTPWHLTGAILAAYALVYPFLAMALVQPYPRTPTFGVPCPTTLFTVGLLLMSTPVRWPLFIIPLLWTVVGGSAAVLFGVATDFLLPVSGIVAGAYLVWQGIVKRQGAA